MARRIGVALLGSLLMAGCSSRNPEAKTTAIPEAHETPVAARPVMACRAPVGLDVVPITEDRSGSTVVLARVHGKLLAYIADEDGSLVRILDVEGAKELGAIAMPGRPARMLMLPGGRLAVTIRDQGRVEMYTPSPIGDNGLDPLCSLETPAEPVDLAKTPDGKTLLALSDWGHALTAFDLETGKTAFSVDLPRSPRAVVASADGVHAYVAHAAGGSMSTIDLRASAPVAEGMSLAGESTDRQSFVTMLSFDDFVPSPVKPGSLRRPSRRSFPDSGSTRSRTACQGFALAEVRAPSPRLFAPMVEVATGDLEVQSSGYGAGLTTTAELPVVAIIDEATGKPRKSSLVAHEPNGAAPPACLLPRAVATLPGSLLVACMGIDAVVDYDISRGEEAPTERRRWSVPSGPTGLAVHGGRAVVWSQFGGEAAVLSLTDPIAEPLKVPVQARPRTEDEKTVALGRALFHASGDKRIASDGRSCASCHPNGRDDGLVWSTPFGPRQTPMLAGRLPDTGPYGWDGGGSDVAHHLGHTLARLEGLGLPAPELQALEHYITTLEGPPVKPPTDPGAIAHGRDVFFAAGCGSCHSADGAWTDGHRHDVASRVSADAVGSFDTPSLRFVGGTAPYFHDGRYPTLGALLATKEGPMGAARGRPPEDLDALEAFVRSL
jgi:mono/diheme cytochrome c family protein